MKVTFERDKLLSAFQTASAVVPSRSPKQVLQNVRLDVSDGTAVLSATDLEIGVRIEVASGEVEEPGSALLSTTRFGAIVREVADAKLRIAADDRSVTVRTERSQFTLPAADPEEFPPVSTFSESKYHEVSCRLLREMIRRTAFATDNESTRYALGGVLLEFMPDRVVAVGTDGRRLATMHGPATSVGGHDAADQTTIVPTKGMHLIEKALAECSTEVQLAPKSNSLLVKGERTTVLARLVDGRFPKWRDVFPKRDGAVKIELPVGPTHSAVRQAAIVTNEDSRGVQFSFGDGRLTLSGQAADVGQSHVELPIAYSGPQLDITLDPRYFSDFLRVLDADKTFTIELRDGESAAVCSTDDGYDYVIMPLARER